jgi:hypothetical protein
VLFTERDWLVYVVNRLPRNLSITCDCMVYWLLKKSVLEKIVRGNQKIGNIRLDCTTFCPGIAELANCGISPFSGTTINEDSMILFYLCLLLFSVLFPVSFIKLFFPVLLVLYRVAD